MQDYPVPGAPGFGADRMAFAIQSSRATVEEASSHRITAMNVRPGQTCRLAFAEAKQLLRLVPR